MDDLKTMLLDVIAFIKEFIAEIMTFANGFSNGEWKYTDSDAE